MVVGMVLLSMGLAQAGELPPVIGGKPAAEGAWPDVALVWARGEPHCTGTLVAPDLVLSAGHCARGATHVSLDHVHKDDAERIRIARVHTHDRWARTLDLAAFRLVRPVEGVRPRALSVDGLVDDAPVTIVGWGARDVRAGTYPDRLMEAEAEVWDADCSDASWGCNRRHARGEELVAGASGADSCNGDSGGPLYLGEGEDAVLVGITSRAIEGWGPPCGDGGIYVRADAAQAWIDTLPDRGEEHGAADGDLDRPPERVGACSTTPAPVGVVGALAAMGLALRRRRGDGRADAE